MANILKSLGSLCVRSSLPIKGLEKDYVTKLYMLATKHECLYEVEKDIKKMKSLYEEDHQFHKILLDPQASDVLQSLGKTNILHPHIINLLKDLNERNEIDLIPKIIETFGKKMDAHRNMIKAVVTSACHLTETQQQKVEEALRKNVEHDQMLEINFKVDPKIEGGLIVKMGKLVIDLSTANKLRQYEEVLRK